MYFTSLMPIIQTLIIPEFMRLTGNLKTCEKMTYYCLNDAINVTIMICLSDLLSTGSNIF